MQIVGQTLQAEACEFAPLGFLEIRGWTTLPLMELATNRCGLKLIHIRG